MKIFVLSFPSCKEYVSRLPNEKTSILSIRNPNSAPYFTPDMNKNINEVLTLNFTDGFQKYQKEFNFDEKKAESIVDFMYRSVNENVENIIIHCNLGLSRSKTVGIVTYEKLLDTYLKEHNGCNQYIYDILNKIWKERKNEFMKLNEGDILTNFIKQNNS